MTFPLVPNLIQGNIATGNGSTASCTFPSNVSAGNSLIAILSNNVTNSVPTDTIGNTWITDFFQGDSDSSGVLGVYRVVITTGGADTVSVSIASGAWTLCILEVSNLATSATLDTSFTAYSTAVGVAGTTYSITSGLATTPGGYVLILAAAPGGSSVFLPKSGQTVRFSQIDTSSLVVADGLSTQSQSSLTASWYEVSSQTYLLAMLNYRPAPLAPLITSGLTQGAGSSITSLSVTPPTIGNCCIVEVATASSVTTTGVTDTAGNTFVLLGRSSFPSLVGEVSLWAAFSVATHSPYTVTATFSASATNSTLVYEEWAGIAQANALIASGIGSGTGTALSIPSAPAATYPFSLALAAIAITGGGTVSGVGMIREAFFNGTPTCNLLDAITGLPGTAFTANAAISSSSPWAGVVAVLRQAAVTRYVTISDTLFMASGSPNVGALITAQPIGNTLENTSVGFVPIMPPWMTATTNGSGVFSLVLPTAEDTDPPNTFWMITLPSNIRYVGKLPATAAALTVSLSQLIHTYGWYIIPARQYVQLP